MLYFKVPHTRETFNHKYVTHLCVKYSDCSCIFYVSTRGKEWYIFEWIYYVILIFIASNNLVFTQKNKTCLNKFGQNPNFGGQWS